MTLQKTIEKHWNNSAEGYDAIIQTELQSFQKDAWTKKILSNAPNKETMQILDIGTGPGYFSVLMGLQGHDVTAIDCTENMLKAAEKNFAAAGISVKTYKMDSHALAFPDASFDLILNRNVTWSLADPEKAYREWVRVLKPGGVLLIFDANWLAGLYDEEIRKKNDENREAFLKKYGPLWNVGSGGENEYNRSLFMGKVQRPAWDRETLTSLGLEVTIEDNIIDEVWRKEEKLIYGATPMFMVKGRKPA